MLRPKLLLTTPLASALLLGSLTLLPASDASAAANSAAGPVPVSLEDDEEVDYSGKSLEDLVAEVDKKRDDVDPRIMRAIADLETREAMEALRATYDKVVSTYMRREVVRALGRFDGVSDAFEPALLHVANVATEAKARELRIAAVDALGNATQNGARFLEIIVESTASDELRERAFAHHVRMGDESNHAWYKKVYSRTMDQARRDASGDSGDKKKTKKRRKKGEEEEAAPKKPIVWPTSRLRAAAMKAIMETIEDSDLEKAFEQDRSMRIKRTALAELARRGSKKAPEYARTIIERQDFRGTDRALAAEILVGVEGKDSAKDMIKLATKSVTPEVLRQRIADLLAELKDEDVDKQLLKLVGKGKGPQKAFALRATKYLGDDKFAKKIRKGLRDKDEGVVLSTIESLATRRDRDSLKDMEKLLTKTKSEKVRRAVLEGISRIYDGENEWVEKLVEYAGHEETDIRNAAMREIKRLGRRNTVDLFVERLTHPNWSTRLIALEALVDQRNAKFLRPIVDQMKNEKGRMEVEFGAALFNLTGKPFGRRQATWDRWLTDESDAPEIIPESKVEEILEDEEERRLKSITTSEFFGIRIDSHRVMFIIDVSGSMIEPVRQRYVGEVPATRIDVAKEELARAIESLDDQALFNIAPFSGGVESWLEEGIATSGDMKKEEALEYVSRLGAGGGTNLFGSLEFAFEDQDIDTIFVLSDGEPSVGDIIDPFLIREVVAELNETRNVVINTIAVGGDLQVLEWLAEDSGGTHVSIQ